MRAIALPLSFLSLLLSGAIFGFFYAWVCSTMWGLDTLEPDVAIKAMQAMNASVRNAVFAPSFFGTPLVMGLAAAACFAANVRRAATAFGLGAAICFFGGVILTMLVHVPMNEALAQVDPTTPDAADIWEAYSADWQVWNQTRAVFTGIGLLCAGWGLFALNR